MLPQRFVFPISIHAPYTGSDADCVKKWLSTIFQSTLPMQGATGNFFNALACKLFQSTLPMQGATFSVKCFKPCNSNFNPRSLCRERLLHAKVQERHRKFQSTLPIQGATPARWVTEPLSFISIHAPYTGSDRDSVYNVARRSNFNPRSLYRERQYSHNFVSLLYNFNPRSLYRERQQK